MAASHWPRPLIVGFLILLLLWAAAFGVLASSRDRAPFPVDQAIDHTLAARPGVNLAADELTPARLDQLSAQGIRFIRFTLPWDEIEPQRGAFEWGRWDAVAAAFADRPDLTPVVVLDRSPEWARRAEDADNALAPPHERRDFGAFARAVAERYRDTYTYYQVWDEPNIAPHWGARPVDPVDYAGLLREGAINIRAADPGARIIAAALAPTTESGGANLSDITYLDQLYTAGGRAWFDYPAAQPYGFDEAPNAAPDPGHLNFARAALLRDVMLRHGDAGTSLWATSFGWNAGEDGPWGAVSPDVQAGYTRGAFDRADRQWPWLGPLLWTGRFAATPDTVQALIDATAPPTVLPPGAHRPDHPALRYTPGWRVTGLAADPSADGDTLEFVFEGTGVALEVQGGPYWACLTATVDGAPANRLPRDESGASCLVLHDPDARTRLILLAEGLIPGPHTVRLVATGGWGQWPLRGVVVTSTSPAPNRLEAALLALTVLASAALLLAVVRPKAVPDLPYLRGVLRPHTQRNQVSPALSLGKPYLLVLAIILAVAYHLTGSGWLNFMLLALFGLLFLYDPGLAPPIIAASLPWWQRTQPVLRWEFGLFEALAWIALLAWSARAVIRPVRLRQLRWRSKPDRSLAIDITVVALFAAGLLATLFAAEQGVAWREFRIVFLFGLVFYVLITRAATGPVRQRAAGLVLGLLAGATIASLAGLGQLVTGQGRVDVEGVGRIAGFYGSPNNLALLLDRAVPLAAALALFGVAFWQSGTRAAVWLRGLFAVIALITLTAAVATFSKGALLLGLPVGLAVVLLGGAWRSGRRWPVGLLVGLIVVAAAGLFVLFQTTRFADLFNFQSGTSFFRLKLWQGSLNMALDHPLLGVGPDNFLYAYRTRYVLPSAWQELNLSHPHNLLLDLWTRLGLVGVAAGVGALVVAFVAGWRLFVAGCRGEVTSPLRDRRVWPLALGLLGGLAATVSHGLIDNSLFLPDLMGWFVAAQAIFWLYLRAET